MNINGTASLMALAAALVAAPATAQVAPGTTTDGASPQQQERQTTGPIQSGAAGESPDIIVTGSFIRGTPEDAALPVDVITADEIQRQGSPTLVELLKALPSSAGVVGDSNQFGAGQTTGSGNVNLRGLGATRTLVLLNGRRLAPSPGGTSVDTNLLPSIAIGRIEVLKDGAAALYGSDAIGGVVNFITRTDLNGLEAQGNFSFIDGSDGDYNLGLNFGTKLAGIDIFLSGAYRHRSELSTRKRGFALNDYFTNPQGGWSPFGNPGTYTPITAAGGAAGVFADPGCSAISGPIVPAATGTPQCVFQYTQFDNLVEDEDHFQVFGSARYRIASGIEAHIEGLFSGHVVPAENSSPSYSPVQFPTAGLNGRALTTPAFFIPASNPGLQALLNSYSAAQLGGAVSAGQARANGVATTILWRPIGVSGNQLYRNGGKEDRRDFEAYRISGGITADLSATTALDVAGTYMENYSDIRTPDIIVSRLELALRGLGGSGCNVAANTPGANGCLYFNPFSSGIARNAYDGRENPLFNPAVANSNEVVDYLFEDYAYRVRTKLLVIDAVLSGKTGIDLGGGEIGFAIGGQYRRDGVKRTVAPLLDIAQNPCVDTPFNGNTACTQRNGAFSFFGPLNNYDFNRDVKAVFAELQVPLFTDALTLQAAVRYEDYGGNIGATTNPKAALRFQATDWLAFRGSASTTFRAPPQVQTVATATTTLAFVSAVGGYRAFDTFGNPDLQAETADTYNAGIILQAGGFNLTVDYYRFDFKGDIGGTPGGDSIAALFPNGAAGANNCAAFAANSPAFYGRFTFNNNICSAANLLRTRLDIVNGPALTTDGIDVSVSWREDALGGRLSVGADGSYVLRYKANDFVVDGVVVSAADDYAGKLDYLGYGSIPELKGQFYVQYDNGIHSLRYTVRYVGEMEDTRGPSTFTARSPLGQTIGDYASIDLNYTIDIEPTGTTLTASVQNLTDRDPPFARLDLNYDPFTGNPLGRVFKIGVRQRF